MNQSKIFFDRITASKGRGYHCLNTVTNGFFSKNTFVKKFDKFEKYINSNKHQNCYINYMPLRFDTSRKTDNVHKINVVALDIELVNKSRPETEINISIMKSYINLFLEKRKIRDYMLVNSGNGYHLYIFFKRAKPLNETILDKHKMAYKNLVKHISNDISNISEGFLNSDDRKDLAGILRIPGTTNTKAGRTVTLEENMCKGNNDHISKIFNSYLSKAKKQLLFSAKYVIKQSKNINQNGLPKDIPTLLKSPLMRMRMDKDLPAPKENLWHSTVVFALQALIYHSGFSNHPDMPAISNEYNQICNCSVDLGSCSYTKDLAMPIFAALKFCKSNNYDAYTKEIKELYLNQ